MVAKMLQRPALVLNRNWQPVNIATVSRALVLVWNESARVVDPTDYHPSTCTMCPWYVLATSEGTSNLHPLC